MDDKIREQLVQQIASAFSHRVHPGDENISDTYCEGQDVTEFYRGRRWQDVDFSDLLKGPGFPWTPWYLTPEAFRYYLPAFLSQLLDYPEEPSYVWEILTLLSPLPPGPLPDMTTLFQRNISGLTSAEREAVRATLEYLLANVHRDLRDWRSKFTGPDPEDTDFIDTDLEDTGPEGAEFIDTDPMSGVRRGVEYWREQLGADQPGE